MATLGTLVDGVRRNLQEISANAGNQSFYLTDNIKKWIGEAYRYYSMYMIEQAEGYFEAVGDLPLTASQETVDLTVLSPTYYKMSVLYKNTPTGRYPLRTSEKRFTATSFIDSTTSYYTEFTYKLRGRTTIVLDPVPTSDEIASSTTGLRAEYIYLPAFPANGTDDSFEFDSNFPDIYDPLIELWATLAALDSKDGTGALSDAATFRARKAELETRFLNNLQQSEDPDSVRYIGNDYSRRFDFN